MPPQRDPLSIRYDAHVRAVMIRAIRAGRNGNGVRAWIASPRAEFRHTDPRGRTAHERAFTRSVYFLMWRVHVNRHEIPPWSVKLTWGEELRDSGRGRRARPVTVRVWPRSQARVRGKSWRDNPSQQSRPADDGRRLIPAP
jgi:hypothetical protein